MKDETNKLFVMSEFESVAREIISCGRLNKGVLICSHGGLSGAEWGVAFVDEAKVLDAYLSNLSKVDREKFERQYMGKTEPVLMKTETRSEIKKCLLDVSMGMFLDNDIGRKRGKYKGRRAKERGWRR